MIHELKTTFDPDTGKLIAVYIRVGRAPDVNGIVHCIRTEELVPGRVMADYDETLGHELIGLEILG